MSDYQFLEHLCIMAGRDIQRITKEIGCGTAACVEDGMIVHRSDACTNNSQLNAIKKLHEMISRDLFDFRKALRENNVNFVPKSLSHIQEHSEVLSDYYKSSRKK